MRREIVICAALAVGAAACSGSEQKKAAEAQQQAAQAAEKGSAEAAKGLEQLAKGLEAMAGGGSGGQKPTAPVSFREMMALFPDLEGWEKEEPTGERMSSPFAFSTAGVAYTKGDSRVEIKMTDSGFNQLLLTPYAMFLTAGYEKETSDGYEKSTTVAGQPGWEKWNTESKDGELNALVGKRFLVQIEGSQIDGIKLLHDVAGKIDMGKLASLK